jgi:hypothetical protein
VDLIHDLLRHPGRSSLEEYCISIRQSEAFLAVTIAPPRGAGDAGTAARGDPANSLQFDVEVKVREVSPIRPGIPVAISG